MAVSTSSAKSSSILHDFTEELAILNLYHHILLLCCMILIDLLYLFAPLFPAPLSQICFLSLPVSLRIPATQGLHRFMLRPRGQSAQ